MTEEEKAEIVEIEDYENGENEDFFSIFDAPEKKRSASHTSRSRKYQSAKPSAKASSIRNKGLQIQSPVAKLFLNEWQHEINFDSTDATGGVVEWSDDGNLQLIENREKFHETSTGVSHMDVLFSLSPLWRRFTVRFIAIMVVMTIFHTIGFVLVTSHNLFEDEDPYVCETESCVKISKWLNSTMNYNIGPCDNFYDFVCGNYDKVKEAEDSFEQEYGQFNIFRSVRSDIHERMIYGELFRNTNDSYIFSQVRSFFKSCLNYASRDEIGVSGFVKTLNDIGLHPDNSSRNINPIAFDIWRYTGQIGFFQLKLYVNPYDGLRKYMAFYDFDDYHDHVNKKDLSTYTNAFQEIKRVMNINNYSAEEMAVAYQKILSAVFNAKEDIQVRDIDLSTRPKDPDPFLCDDFFNSLDSGFGKITIDTFRLHHIVPMDDVQIGRYHFALYICDGGLNKVLNKKDANYPNVDATLSYKVYWIMWMFYTYFENLNPAFKRNFMHSKMFPKAGASPRGVECLHALQNTLPHILHERLMKSYRISDKDMEMMELAYTNTKEKFRKWLHEDERSSSFGNDTLYLYRDTANFTLGLQNIRFSVSDFEKYGYGESINKISKNDFLNNVQIFFQILSDNDLKKWRLEEGYFLPVSHHSMKYIIKEMVATEYQMRPKLYHHTLMPAILYTPLYSNKDLLALYFGGIRSFLTADIIYRWRHYTWVREDAEDVNLDPVDIGTCTVYNSATNNKEKIVNISDFRADYIPYHLIYDILLSMFKEERQLSSENRIRKTLILDKLLGFEQYSEEKLVFMKMIRHQCASNISDLDKILTGLSNSVAFQDAWKCAPDTFMNPSKKCYKEG